jgi:type IV pilus assembly protein PilV
MMFPVGRQAGITMIEVLVAVLILAVGLLGVAGLQSMSLKNTSDIFFEQQSMSYSQDLINRIMANRNAANDGDYSVTPPTTEPANDCSASDCTSAQMAAWDLWQWNEMLTSSFASPPSAATTVNWDDTLGEYTISITWDAAGSGSGYSAPTCTSADNRSAGCFFAAYRVMR